MRLRTHFILKLLLSILITLTVSCRGQGATRVAEFSDQPQILPATITVVYWNAQKGKNLQFASDLKLILEQEKPDIVFL